MSKSSGLGQNLYIGGYDITGDVGSISNCSGGHNLLENTGIDKSAVERINGLAHGTLEFATWFNDAAGQEHLALRGLVTTDRIVTYTMGTAVAKQAACMVAKQVNYDWERGADGGLAGTVQCLSTNGTPLEWCELLTAGKASHASASSTASKNDSAQTLVGFIGYLHIFSIASGTPTVVIEDSANNSDWATLVSFTAVADGAEPTAERKTVTGTVDQYLRATTTGTFTTCVFNVAYRRGTAVDDEDLS